MGDIKLPTCEQWEPVLDALECATRAYWRQCLDPNWDYMLDDTEKELVKIVMEHFPDINEKCKQQAIEQIEEMQEAHRAILEELEEAK